MIIDHPSERDIPFLRGIWKEAFGDGDAFLDGFYERGFSADRCRCVYMDGRPVSVLYWFDCAWQGKKLAYLYAVATDKAYRGRRLAGKLLEDTHSLLKSLGYGGTVLVPGSQGLFSFYEPLGYRACCPMEKRTVSAGSSAACVMPITPEQYGHLRTDLLPAGGVIQAGATLSYLATYAAFWEAEECILAATAEADTLHIHEYLGGAEKLPGILRAMGMKEGILRIAGGGTVTAMYRSLDGSPSLPAYFGLTLG